MITKHFKYFLSAISAVVIWGTFSIPLRNLKEYSSEQILSYRTFISLIITWVIMMLFRKNQLRSDILYLTSLSKQSRKKTLWLILISGVLIATNWLTFIYTVNHISLKSAAFAYMICPLITATGGYFILKEHLSTIKLTAIGIALLSIIISAQGSITDVFWSIFIASSFAFYLITQRVIVGLDKFNLLGIQLIIISLLVLPVFLGNPEPFPITLNFWVNSFIIALLFTIIPLLLSSYALIGLPSSTFGIIIYLNPLVAFAVAFLYFDEGITVHQLYAYLLLLLSVIIFNWSIISLLFNKRNKKAINLGR